MNNQSMMMGMLIKKYRIEQNMSQESLCQGICAVSYLSKIEKGSVTCSDEILHQLMDVLGIDLNHNPGKIKMLKEAIDHFYRSYFLHKQEEIHRWMDLLNEEQELLQHSSLAIDYMLIQGLFGLTRVRFLDEDPQGFKNRIYELLDYVSYMSPSQTHLTHYLIGYYEMIHHSDFKKALLQFQRSARIKQDGIILEALASANYNLGNYAESIRLGDLAYKQLMEEGYLERGIEVNFVIAAAYANVKDIDNMLTYYQRLLTLNEQSSNSREAFVYYNIGSTYLAVRNYQEAKQHLEKSYAAYHKEDSVGSDKFYVLQKLALVAYGQQNYDLATTYTKELLEIYDRIKHQRLEPSMKVCLDWLITLCIKKETLESETSVEILRKLYKQARKDSHHGFQTFYGDYLIEALKAQHKYKEALKITEEIYVKWKLSSNV